MTRRSLESPTLSRRQFLAVGTTTAVTTVAGCSTVVNYIADRVLEDVNVFNETDRRLRGTIEVVGPSGATVLDETFDIAPSDSESNESDQGAVFYADVWQEAGSYEVTVTLSDAAIDGQSEASATVDIDNPDEEMLGVPLGADNVDEPIGFRVGEELTDFQ